MARGPFLSEARGTAGLQDIGHIAQRSPIVPGIDTVEITAHRRTATIVIHNHRVFPGRIEILRQIHPAIDRLTTGIHIVPVFAVGHSDITHDAFTVIQAHLLHRSLAFSSVGREGRGIFRNTIADIADDIRMRRYIHPRHIVTRMLQLHYLPVRRIHLVKTNEVAVFGSEIHQSIAPSPIDGLHRRIEVLGERFHLLGGNIVEIELIVVHVRCHIGGQCAANTVEGLRRAFEENLRTVGRERGIG